MSVLSSHHTVWVSCEGCAPTPERYATDGNRLVVFGDRALAHVPAGIRARAGIHEIAGGPLVTELPVRVSEPDPGDVNPQALLELLDHVSLGRTPAETDRALAEHAQRRILHLDVVGPN